MPETVDEHMERQRELLEFIDTLAEEVRAGRITCLVVAYGDPMGLANYAMCGDGYRFPMAGALAAAQAATLELTDEDEAAEHRLSPGSDEIN